jgi:hypothetical protein
MGSFRWALSSAVFHLAMHYLSKRSAAFAEGGDGGDARRRFDAGDADGGEVDSVVAGLWAGSGGTMGRAASSRISIRS